MAATSRRFRGVVIGTLLILALGLLFFSQLFCPALFAQGASASIQGTVTDASGAVVPGVTVSATNLETNLQRDATTSSTGFYVIPNLPPGKYRVQFSMAGFQAQTLENIELVIGQKLVSNAAMQVGEVNQQITISGEAPLVNTSTAQVSGLVGEREVKDLPLNGRSFDNLITLNPGTVNINSVKGGASGSSAVGNQFAVAGRRPGENLFLWNGVEYPGGSGVEAGTPGGVSGQLLGIEAVREFNVMSNIDSAESGHRAAGQINVVTMSGTNSFHGSLFEFLRNSKVDARNFYDSGAIPPFKRNQFGASAGGPIKKDRTFIFGNYEGFRQRLGLSSVAVVPDELARTGQLPDANGVYRTVPGYNPAVAPYFKLWPEPNGPELLSNGKPTGTALAYTNPSNPIREDFGILRVDHTFSGNDTISGSYTIDDGENVSSGANPISLLVSTLRTQVLTATETHIFSPSIVNSFTAGYARPKLIFILPTSLQPAGTEPFVSGNSLGQLKIGGGAGVGASSLSIAGSGPNTGSYQIEALNKFTYEDQVHITKGSHSITTGIWAERLQWNAYDNAFGQAVFPDLTSFLQGKPTTIAFQLRGALNPWRTWLTAWYVQDSVKLRSNLTLSVGLRHEFTTGYNHRYGLAANFVPDSNGVLLTKPQFGTNLFTKNNARWLFGPRAGLAWDPWGDGKTSVRAGFGIAYSLLDSVEWCCRTINPTYGTYQASNASFPFQVNPDQPFPPGLNVAQGGGAGGIQPDAYTPTVVNYRLEVERELGPAMSLRVSYVGSHGYHELLRADSNQAAPILCSAAQKNCPSGLQDGTKYFPTPIRRQNPALSSLVQLYTSSYNNFQGLLVDWTRRFRQGLALRANYTFSKNLDNASSVTSLQAIGSPSVTLDAANRNADYGPSAFDMRNRFTFSGTYELPIGSGKALLSNAAGVVNKAVSGWQVNLITSFQGGFPLTPQLGFNQSRSGNTSNPDRPDMASSRTLSGIYKKTPDQWFDPTAFALPLAGTFGNAGRNILNGPGLQEVDLSVFKTTRLTEKFELQFRAETFNLLNHTNFGLPSAVVLTTSGAPASSAGRITTTATTSRQIQFGLKLKW